MLKSLSTVILVTIFTLTANAQMEIISYNIKFANEDDGENSWSKRKEHLTNQLKFYEPDIFGVQEAVVKQVEHFEENLPNYEYVGVARDDGKSKGEFTAIFYDRTTFKVVKNGTFWLSETPEEPSKGWDADFPRICTYALFEEKEAQEQFWVFNTHFDHRGAKAREESAKLIVKKIEELNSENLPVILMGDFNLESGSKSIQYLSEKMNDSKKVADFVFGPEGTFNAYNFDEPVKRRIDYIFTTDDLEVLKYAVLSDSKDLKYPSDHLPVFVELQFD